MLAGGWRGLRALTCAVVVEVSGYKPAKNALAPWEQAHRRREGVVCSSEAGRLSWLMPRLVLEVCQQRDKTSPPGLPHVIHRQDKARALPRTPIFDYIFITNIPQARLVHSMKTI